jgi:hypothetical protein
MDRPLMVVAGLTCINQKCQHGALPFNIPYRCAAGPLSDCVSASPAVHMHSINTNDKPRKPVLTSTRLL